MAQGVQVQAGTSGRVEGQGGEVVPAVEPAHGDVGAGTHGEDARHRMDHAIGGHGHEDRRLGHVDHVEVGDDHPRRVHHESRGERHLEFAGVEVGLEGGHHHDARPRPLVERLGRARLLGRSGDLHRARLARRAIEQIGHRHRPAGIDERQRRLLDRADAFLVGGAGLRWRIGVRPQHLLERQPRRGIVAPLDRPALNRDRFITAPALEEGPRVGFEHVEILASRGGEGRA